MDKKTVRNFIGNIIWNDLIAKNFKFILKQAFMIIEDILPFQTKFLTRKSEFVHRSKPAKVS
jgi:hypothetical protein